ncbi:hypothetical protein AAFL31_08585 [Klebsiella huaxiensis]|uniref:hypothetical protein n=1 Tax=Klebsiella huaxiensis TaxID=2153354 RepID=UPI003167912C
MTDGIEPMRKGDFWATITDESGKVVCSFRLSQNDRHLLSNLDGEIAARKIAKDEHLWSRVSLVEIIQEISSKN